jgi:hypothetical protein
MQNHRHADGKTVVAESDLVTIEACGCGVMHLHFGPLSMRFTEEGLEDVQRTITEALLRVQERVPESRGFGASLFMRGAIRGEA